MTAWAQLLCNAMEYIRCFAFIYGAKQTDGWDMRAETPNKHRRRHWGNAKASATCVGMHWCVGLKVSPKSFVVSKKSFQ